MKTLGIYILVDFVDLFQYVFISNVKKCKANRVSGFWITGTPICFFQAKLDSEKIASTLVVTNNIMINKKNIGINEKKSIFKKKHEIYETSSMYLMTVIIHVKNWKVISKKRISFSIKKNKMTFRQTNTCSKSTTETLENDV